MKKLTFFLAVSLLMLLPQVSWAVGGVEGIGAPLPPNRIGDDGFFAMGTEMVTDGGLENWTGDTPDNWTETNESVGVRDILDEGVTIRGGSHAAKLLATDNDTTEFRIEQNITLVADKKFEGSGWYHYANRTAGNAVVTIIDSGWNHAPLSSYSTTGSYTRFALVFTPDQASCVITLRLLGETTAGTLYFDDISVRDVDLIARRYGGDLIGAIGMQQIELWDKWSHP